jgi:hypothetical protein
MANSAMNGHPSSQPTIMMDELRPGSIRDEMNYEQRLLQYTINAGQHEPRFLIFRGLQTLNIIRLQNELAKCKNTMWANRSASRDETGRLTALLHEYSGFKSHNSVPTCLH